MKANLIGSRQTRSDGRLVEREVACPALRHLDLGNAPEMPWRPLLDAIHFPPDRDAGAVLEREDARGALLCAFMEVDMRSVTITALVLALGGAPAAGFAQGSSGGGGGSGSGGAGGGGASSPGGTFSTGAGGSTIGGGSSPGSQTGNPSASPPGASPAGAQSGNPAATPSSSPAGTQSGNPAAPPLGTAGGARTSPPTPSTTPTSGSLTNQAGAASSGGTPGARAETAKERRAMERMRKATQNICIGCGVDRRPKQP
jgi:hypothetical protein